MEKLQDILKDQPNKLIALSTKLAVKPKYRKTPALYLLLAKAYEICRLQQVHFCLGGGNPCNIQLYEQMGFRRFGSNFSDPGYGMLVALNLIIEDVDHLKAVRSPLYRVARKKDGNALIASQFFNSFPQAGECVNSQLVSKQELWEYLGSKLGGKPNEKIALLKGLDAEETSNLLCLGAVFPCKQGDSIVCAGDISNEVFTLLSGTVEVRNKAGIYALKPGQSFGGIGIITNQPQSESVTAVDDSEILVISRQLFEKMQRLFPIAADKILTNLADLLKAEVEKL
ncbi:cyclic nucleotide-binding domain-containing protein [Sporomusa sp.]|uniref:cyclic nucleotide-binding domain-containing protein n=1 Tax=Sporomusa sp. TaxID=2078658 RepID=UPI002C7EC8E5|nr:cyclic nucleotide-binding domain-containing protein [Sporomusa sp.]HWR43423.1 cyclic nucleotide-binding domain-containing protein [Sporomusa sp.]